MRQPEEALRTKRRALETLGAVLQVLGWLPAVAVRTGFHLVQFTWSWLNRVRPQVRTFVVLLSIHVVSLLILGLSHYYTVRQRLMPEDPPSGDMWSFRWFTQPFAEFVAALAAVNNAAVGVLDRVGWGPVPLPPRAALTAVVVCSMLACFWAITGRHRNTFEQDVLPIVTLLASSGMVLGVFSYLPFAVLMDTPASLWAWVLTLLVGNIEEFMNVMPEDVKAYRESLQGMWPDGVRPQQTELEQRIEERGEYIVTATTFNLARTFALGATSLSLLSIFGRTLRNLATRISLWLASSVDVVVGTDDTALRLTRALARQNRQRWRFHDWHAPDMMRPMRNIFADPGVGHSRTLSRANRSDFDRVFGRPRRVVLVVRSLEGPVPTSAREAGAIVVTEDPTDEVFLRRLFVHRPALLFSVHRNRLFPRWFSRRIRLRRLYVVGDNPRINAKVVTKTTGVLQELVDSHTAKGHLVDASYPLTTHGSVPRISLRLDDARAARDWRIEQLAESRRSVRWLMDSVNTEEVVAQSIRSRLVHSVDRPGEALTMEDTQHVVLVGSSPLVMAMVDEIAWSRWQALELLKAEVGCYKKLIEHYDELAARTNPHRSTRTALGQIALSSLALPEHSDAIGADTGAWDETPAGVDVGNEDASATDADTSSDATGGDATDGDAITDFGRQDACTGDVTVDLRDGSAQSTSVRDREAAAGHAAADNAAVARTDSATSGDEASISGDAVSRSVPDDTSTVDGSDGSDEGNGSTGRQKKTTAVNTSRPAPGERLAPRGVRVPTKEELQEALEIRQRQLQWLRTENKNDPTLTEVENLPTPPEGFRWPYAQSARLEVPAVKSVRLLGCDQAMQRMVRMDRAPWAGAVNSEAPPSKNGDDAATDDLNRESLPAPDRVVCSDLDRHAGGRPDRCAPLASPHELEHDSEHRLRRLLQMNQECSSDNDSTDSGTHGGSSARNGAGMIAKTRSLLTGSSAPSDPRYVPSRFDVEHDKPFKQDDHVLVVFTEETPWSRRMASDIMAQRPNHTCVLVKDSSTHGVQKSAVQAGVSKFGPSWLTQGHPIDDFWLALARQQHAVTLHEKLNQVPGDAYGNYSPHAVDQSVDGSNESTSAGDTAATTPNTPRRGSSASWWQRHVATPFDNYIDSVHPEDADWYRGRVSLYPWVLRPRKHRNRPQVPEFFQDDNVHMLCNVLSHFQEHEQFKWEPYRSSGNETDFTLKASQENWDNAMKDLARKEHNRWKDRRVNYGWTLGALRSDYSRRHPLLKDFDLLTAYQQGIAVGSVKWCMDRLNASGLRVISVKDAQDKPSGREPAVGTHKQLPLMDEPVDLSDATDTSGVEGR